VILTRRERNEILQTISAWGVDPASCELEDFAHGMQAEVIHRPTQSRFRMRNSNDQLIDFHFNVKLIVSGADWAEYIRVDWDALIEHLEVWLREVRYEANTPDLWAELQQVPEVMATAQAADASNAPFTPEEQDEIGSRLEEVKDLLQEQFDLTDDQLAALEQRLDDAGEAARHSDRKTWLYTFYGAAMSTFMTDEIPPHVIQTVVSTVLYGIAHIFGIGGTPPIITA
jgi:hypothetical protein